MSEKSSFEKRIDKIVAAGSSGARDPFAPPGAASPSGPTGPTEKGKTFERLIKKFFEQDVVQKNIYQKLWLWDEYPDRKHRDLGADLIAQNEAGGRVAIQCKYISQGSSKTLDKKQIDSFLAFLGRADIQSGVIVSTAKQLSKNAQQAINGLSKEVIYMGLDKLEQSTVDWNLLSTHKTQKPRIKHQLKAHQKKALQDVLKGFQTNSRGKLIMPCGTGKTFTSLKIVEKMLRPTGAANSKGGVANSKKRDTNAKETPHYGYALVLMPSLSLVSQIYREFMTHSDRIVPFIVCSDSKAHKAIGDDRDNPMGDINPFDLPEPSTTDPHQLVKRLEAVPSGNRKLKVIFSTYHSIDVIAKAQQILKQKNKHIKGFSNLDLIVCDEAHRTTGVEDRGSSKKSYWTQVHDADYIKASKRLYMTATPRIYEDKIKTKADDLNYEVYSMDKKEYGPLFHELKFSQAISGGLLSDYKVVVLAVDERVMSSTMQEAFSQNNELKTDDAVKIVGCYEALSKNFIKNKYQVVGEGYKNIKNKEPMQRAVAFTSTIDESKSFKTHFEQVIEGLGRSSKNENVVDTAGLKNKKNLHTAQGFKKQASQQQEALKCEVRHVDGQMDSMQRNEQLRWLKSEVAGGQCKILSNPRCLSEGVDVPALDAVIFLKARKSEVDIVQSVGRVMRKPADGQKEFGYVILPIVISSDVELSEALDNNDRYKHIWKVVQALRSHDDRLEATIDRLPYTNELPKNLVVGFIGDNERDEKTQKEQVEADLQKAFAKNWEQAVVAKLVDKCGDRAYLDHIAVDVKKAFEQVKKRLQAAQKVAKSKKVLDQFLKKLHKTLNPSIGEEQAIEMLAIHSVTKPLFQALFETRGQFVGHNPVAQAMEKALKFFNNQAQAESQDLKNTYYKIKRRVEDIDSLHGRQNLIKEIYQRVFKTAFPKEQERLGMVYTPVEVVDFMLNSINEILKRDFDGTTLSSSQVKIIDPFAGTGTFLSRLIENKNLISDKDLSYKYNNELLFSEIALLAYYIGTINIENSYHFRKEQLLAKRAKNCSVQEGYEPFKGAIFSDTFQSAEDEEDVFGSSRDSSRQRGFENFEQASASSRNKSGFGHSKSLKCSQDRRPAELVFEAPLSTRVQSSYKARDGWSDFKSTSDSPYFFENSLRRGALKKGDLRVIIGNPPYSVGQKNENDNNKNLKYKILDKLVKATYAKASQAKLKRALYDPYVKALRWASDKIKQNDQGGVIAFISNASFIDGSSLDGLRYHLAQDFDKLYVVNLKGGVRGLKGEAAKKQGDNIFGQASMCQIAISFLVKKPGVAQKLGVKKASIVYSEIEDALTTKQKLNNLMVHKHIFSLKNSRLIKPDVNNDWLNQCDIQYKEFFPMGRRTQVGIFKVYSRGISTFRDTWTYHFSKKNLAQNIKTTINFYNAELLRYEKALNSHSQAMGNKGSFIDAFVNNNAEKISWSRGLKNNLRRGKKLRFDSLLIRTSLYRPFFKSNLYYTQDRALNEEVYQTPQSYPVSQIKNLSIVTSGKGAKSFSVLMVDRTPDLHTLDTSQHFPRYTFEPMGKSHKEIRQNKKPAVGAQNLSSASSTLRKECGSQNKKCSRSRFIEPPQVKGYKSIDNINHEVVQKFQKHYKDLSINGDQIFFYMYGLLHSKQYVQKYQNDLLKALPRIAMVKDFHKFSKIGQQLADLHVNYDKIELEKVKAQVPSLRLHFKGQSFKALTELKQFILHKNNSRAVDGPSKSLNNGLNSKTIPSFKDTDQTGLASILKCIKMKHPPFVKSQAVAQSKGASKTKPKDISQVVYNEHIYLSGIPHEAYQYKVNGWSAIKWVMNRYQIKTDPKSKIVNDPNQSDDPLSILRLLMQVIYVSLQSAQLIEQLPHIDEDDLNTPHNT